MPALSIKPRGGAVERTLVNGGFDKNAFLLAATMVKAKMDAQRGAALRPSGAGLNGQRPAPSR